MAADSGLVPTPTMDAKEIAELYGIARNSVYRLHLRRRRSRRRYASVGAACGTASW